MKTPAFIFDIDGTLALMGDRSPFDWKRVGIDAPNLPIITILSRIQAHGQEKILLVSGRDGVAYEDTERWLKKHDIPYDALYMRPARNREKDYIIKERIYHRDIEPHYEVIAVFDDRDQTVHKWRELGLTCLQVAEGNF